MVLTLAGLLGTISARAQETSTPPLQPTVRVGEKYKVGSEVMNARAYRGYLQNTCPSAFSQYDNGYKTAMAGWGLLAGGPVLAVGIGFPMALLGGFGGSAYPPGEAPSSIRRSSTAMIVVGYSSIAIGGAAFVASFPCLGVGYSRMHKAAKVYNTSCANQPTTYWTFQTTGDGMGLALHF